ncbi:hypothetical protein CN943_21870 [Bacillus thuringiensis]|uniref:hypothetical protein n=1 Tax=Bacillus thuringiensis TaxID=1428 RepID=UPI000BFB78F8|nr:hypothetical protein [Bacillus thuringiensis]PGL92400.1 hypothetical protein CN943_21870 [Bacillus thuringiensis]
MTLIAGIILPKGILMVSDTRSLETKTNNVANEYKRKITFLTPTVILGTAGQENTFRTAEVLRHALYPNHDNLTIDSQRDSIINLYKHVNSLHINDQPQLEYVGDILMAELDKEKNTYKLLYSSGSDEFNGYTIYNQVKDVVLIGADIHIQNNVQSKIEAFLNSLSIQELNDTLIYDRLAKKCGQIFIEQAASYYGMNNKQYCVYLSMTEDNFPGNAVFLQDNNTKHHSLSHTEDGPTIIIPNEG